MSSNVLVARTGPPDAGSIDGNVEMGSALRGSASPRRVPVEVDGPSVADTFSGTERTALVELSRRVEQLSERLGAQIEHLAALSAEVKRLGVEERLLADLHNENRDLREQFHEREVLLPLFRSLIGIADRCSDETAKLRVALSGQASALPLEAVLAIRHVLQAREADRVELEALLAAYGVEPYRQEADRFSPGAQKCIQRVPTQRRERHEQVATRLLPGYRRSGTVLRPECVAVYVFTAPSTTR